MDDDIALDPRMIRRLTDALGHVGERRILGGAMLETDRPRMLHEAGARLQPGWSVASYGSGRNMALRENLALFDRVPSAHYNGWWFCAVPVAAARAAGLPLPLFIRGDDIEYGCRMADVLDLPTVPLPGCAVWHDSFGGKAQPWLTYYDYRNLLINAALYPGIAPPPHPVEVLGAIFARLLCHQYGMAAAVTASIEAYLSGPEAVMQAPQDAAHARISGRFGVEDGERRATAPPVPPRPGPVPPLPRSIPVAALLFAWRFLAISVGIRRARPQARSLSLYEIHPGSAGPGPYHRRVDPEGRACVFLAPDRRRLWRGSLRAFATWARYLHRRRRAACLWREGAAAQRSPEAWQRRFDP